MKEGDDDKEEGEDGVKSKVTVEHADESASLYLNETLGVSHLFALLSDALVEGVKSQQDPLEILSNTILKLRNDNNAENDIRTDVLMREEMNQRM